MSSMRATRCGMSGIFPIDGFSSAPVRIPRPYSDEGKVERIQKTRNIANSDLFNPPPEKAPEHLL